MTTTLERILTAKSSPQGECLIWTGSVRSTAEPYGRIRFQKKIYETHRVSYEVHHGPIPAGMLVRHTCDNPRCVRPAHLVLGTDADNAMDREVRRRPSRRLPDSKVREIREAVAAGASTHAVARAFGVAQTTAYNIANNRSYRWVDA